jgi:hypothetical protein
MQESLAGKYLLVTGATVVLVGRNAEKTQTTRAGDPATHPQA